MEMPPIESRPPLRTTPPPVPPKTPLNQGASPKLDGDSYTPFKSRDESKIVAPLPRKPPGYADVDLMESKVSGLPTPPDSPGVKNPIYKNASTEEPASYAAFHEANPGLGFNRMPAYDAPLDPRKNRVQVGEAGNYKDANFITAPQANLDPNKLTLDHQVPENPFYGSASKDRPSLGSRISNFFSRSSASDDSSSPGIRDRLSNWLQNFGKPSGNGDDHRQSSAARIDRYDNYGS